MSGLPYGDPKYLFAIASPAETKSSWPITIDAACPVRRLTNGSGIGSGSGSGFPGIGSGVPGAGAGAPPHAITPKIISNAESAVSIVFFTVISFALKRRGCWQVRQHY